MAIETNIDINVRSGKAKAELSTLDRKTKELSRSSKGLTTGLNRLQGAFKLAAIAAAGVGFARLTKEAVEYADRIAKTSSKLGVATDALQEYRFAASQTGVEQRALDVGLQRFIRRVGEAATGTGVLAEVFDKYNIQVHDSQGNMRDANDILDDYADRISAAGSSQEKLLLAFKAFDTEGAAMVNTLGQGSTGLQRLRQQARQLGVVMDEDLIQKAVVASDKWDVLTKQIGTKFKSALISTLGVFVDLRTAQEKLNDALHEKGDILAKITEAEISEDRRAGQRSSRLKQELREHERLIERLRREVQASDDLKKAQIDINNNPIITEESVEALDDMDLMLDAVIGQMDALDQEWARNQVGLGDLSATAVESFDAMEESMGAMTSGLENELVRAAQEGEFSFRKMADAIIGDLVRIAVRASITAPIMAGFGITPNAKGNVFSGGEIQAFANGGVVNGPTLFPMAKGMGLMGEAGPEAIMPLSRGADGKLGVKAQQSGTVVNVNNYTNSNVSTSESTGPSGEKVIEFLIEEKVGKMVQTGRMDKALSPYNVRRRGSL